MANRYVLKFNKTGYAKYTSHLDLMRFFKRSFRKTGITLKYSQGFNPHPKMSFAQPLSLGYSSSCEYLEFETDIEHEPYEMLNMMSETMPDGLELIWCKELKANVKSLAAAAESADYKVCIPVFMTQEELDKLAEGYMAQDEILTLKRQKKDKKMVTVNIKNMIRSFDAKVFDNMIVLKLQLDCGSVSNCSPELVITSFCDYASINIPRYKMEVERKSIKFVNNLQL